MLKLSRLAAILAVPALVISVSAYAGTTAFGYNLPNLGNPSNQTISPAKAHRIGARIYARLRAQGLIVRDPQLVEFVRSIGRRLLAHTKKNGQHVTYHIIKRTALNAFTVPGGYIAVLTGAIAACDNESELAAIMAHETAHATQHHVIRQLEAAKGVDWQNLAMMLAGAIAGASTGNGGAVPAAVTGGLTRMQEQRASFSRSQEAEADRLGIYTMTYAHFNPHAMLDLLKKINRQEGLNGLNGVGGNGSLLDGFLRVPTASQRIPDVEALLKQVPKRKVRTSPIFPLMRERARVLQASSSKLDRLRAGYQRKLAHGEDSAANAYGYALTLIRLDDAKKAIGVLKPYARSHPRQSPWQLALASAEAARGRHNVALKRLKHAKNRFTDSSAVQLAYASALLASNKPAAMRDFLLSREGLLKRWSEAQSLLAKGASRQGRIGEAYFRRAKALAMRGAYPRAINQLKSVLRTDHFDSYNKSRLSALRQQLVVACKRTYGARQCRQAAEQHAKNNHAAS